MNALARLNKLVFMIGGLLLLAACQAQATPVPVPATQPAPRAAAAQSEVAQVVEPVPADEEMEDSCISCHSDKDRLINTAKPEEEDLESESTGEG